MVKDEIDLEFNWKILRKKLEENIDKDSGLEEEIEEQEQETRDQQFTEVLQQPEFVEVKIPILEKVEDSSEQTRSLEDINKELFSSVEPKKEEIKVSNKPKYLANEENIYNQSRRGVEPSVLRPRDTMAREDIPRHELMNRRAAMSGINFNQDTNPEILKREEEGKDYYTFSM